MKRYLVSITVLISIASARSGATSCPYSDPKDIKSNAYLKDLYETTQAIGIFEVTEVGPLSEGQLAGRVVAKIKMKPVRILKGKIENEHIHEYMGTQEFVPYEVKRQYLMALKISPGAKMSVDGACDWTFKIDLKDADFYIKKFESFKKLEEKKAKASNKPVH